MKKLTMICMAALLMLAASCKKDKKTEIENAGSGFRATVESHEGTGKTHLDGLAVKWNSGDAILVKSRTCPEPKRFTTTGTDARANFDAAESLPEDFYTPDYTGYYPGFENNPAGVHFSGDQLTLPATQQYDGNSTFANGANPMAATSSETLLPFKNICGVLKLQLHSATACNVNNITITSNEGEQLWGTGTVGFDTDNNPTLDALTGGSTLTLNCNGAAMSENDAEPSTYYFVVPAGTLGTSFTVKVTDGNGNVWSKTATATQNTIARSKITAMPELEVATHTPVSPSSVTITGPCVNCAYNVGGSVTVPSGSHTCEFGLVYSETDDTPTIEEGAQKIVAGSATFSDTQSFTADLTGLTVGTTYHVRAYAKIDGVAYSTEVKDIVGGDGPQPMTWTGGKSPYPFTVGDNGTPGDDSDDIKVYFSQGNLQYIGSVATPYWKFADHQFDFIGNGQDGSYASNIDRDFFGWGTSGYNHGATCYQPWSTNTAYNKYYAYSTSDYTYNLYDQSGMADWGKANSISNGTGSSWRTLTGGSSGEWYYLINSRDDAANLYGEGKVGDCTPGLIILPDDWSLPAGLSFTPGMSDYSNVYSYSQWAQMEAAGAVFLPTAGYRNAISVYNVGEYGSYWSSSYCDDGSACSLIFRSGDVTPGNGRSSRYVGFSVRLVSGN